MTETTFEKFITNNPKEKKLFDEEYKQFHLSELLLEKAETCKTDNRLETITADLI